RLGTGAGAGGRASEIWGGRPRGEPLPVTNCRRMFMSPDAAVELLVEAVDYPPGRYGPIGVDDLTIVELAERLHPGRRIRFIPLRTGDRPIEKLAGRFECIAPWSGIALRIRDAWETS